MYTDFRLTIPRLRQRIEELRHAVVRDREEITSWRAHDGNLDDGQNPTLDDSAWPALESWDGATAPAWSPKALQNGPFWAPSKKPSSMKSFILPTYIFKNSHNL